MAAQKIRVLSMDGGGVLSLLTLFLLRRIEALRPGFLDNIDILAGTSAGGINSLLLAASTSPEAAVEKCIQLWSGSVPVYKTPLWRKVASLNGIVALVGNTGFHEYLTHQLGKTRLSALPRKVVIPTLDINGGAKTKNWRPRVFHNLGGTGIDEKYGKELAVDVALRTSAAPVMLPIYQGYVDGGLYANNPSMCALAEIFRHVARPPIILDDVCILSIGTGLQPVTINVHDADWGWAEWVLNPAHPLLLLEAAIDSVELAVDFQCRHFLGMDRYFRLNPPLHRVVPRHQDYGNFATETLQQELEEIAEQFDLRALLEWIDQTGWLTGPANALIASSADDASELETSSVSTRAASKKTRSGK